LDENETFLKVRYTTQKECIQHYRRMLMFRLRLRYF